MKFWEAMKAIEEGEKIRLCNWEPTRWVSKESDRWEIQIEEEITHTGFYRDWELYQEPEKTISFAEIEKGLMMAFECVAQKILFESRLLEDMLQESPEFPEWVKEYSKKLTELNWELLNKEKDS